MKTEKIGEITILKYEISQNGFETTNKSVSLKNVTYKRRRILPEIKASDSKSNIYPDQVLGSNFKLEQLSGLAIEMNLQYQLNQDLSSNSIFTSSNFIFPVAIVHRHFNLSTD